MALSRCSIRLVLDLIEDRINQLDPLVPRDTDDLQDLLRCREEMKVTALTAGPANHEPRLEATRLSTSQMVRHQARARLTLGVGLDVI